MSTYETQAEVSRIGAPAPFVRIFGWSMLVCVAAYLVNNFFYIRFDWPGAVSAVSGGGATAMIQAAIYVIPLLLVVAFVVRTPTRALRWESLVISNFNIFLVRACFWAVVLVGIADATIAFMRVENFLPIFFSEDMVREFGRAHFLGTYIHIPLIVVGIVVAMFTRTLGFTWLALLIVAAELLIVISRFIFSYEQALMGDLVRYWYAALFLFASAYTLLEEGHVRVDVFYTNFSSKKKGMVNALGAILLGISTCWVILVVGLGGKQSIINSPVANFEVTQTGGVGMYIKYQMAGFLAIFAITMLIQFVSYLFDAYADWREEPGGHEHDSHMTA
jgi:TRAP-type mannitol/chloroaromatic compound transport system permease small subunit